MSALDSTDLVRGVLQSIITLAENLGLKVTAEGIETDAQSEVLTQMGANYLQGFLLSRPLRASDLPALMQKVKRGIRPEQANLAQLFDITKVAG